MASTILMLDDYSWTASFGLFDLVLELVAERVSDPATLAELQNILKHEIGAFNLEDLPPVGRDQVLRVFREDIVDAVEASPLLTRHEETRRSTIGHVKVLRLMANDIARAEPR